MENVENNITETTDEQTSPSIGKLAEALSKAQGQMSFASKDSENPFFKKKYADLASVWNACRQALSENQLAVIQTTKADNTAVKDCQDITVITILAHARGEWIKSSLRMKPEKAGPQAIGSTLTYARRYALAAIVGIAQDDDDAESGTDRNNNNKKKPEPKKEPLPTPDTKSGPVKFTFEQVMPVVKEHEEIKKMLSTLRLRQSSIVELWNKHQGEIFKIDVELKDLIAAQEVRTT